MKKIVAVVRIFLSNPITSIRYFNYQRFKTLISAIDRESENNIRSNLKKVGRTTTIPIRTKEVVETIEIVKNIEKRGFKELWDNTYIRNHLSVARKQEKIHSKTIDFNHVAIIGDLNIWQCKKYRVLQKIELFKRSDIGVDYSFWLDTPRCINLIQKSSLLILYRVPDCNLISSYLDEAHRLGIQVAYDIDDPVFDEEIYRRNKNIEHLSTQEKDNLINNAKHYASLIRQCDVIISSTPGLSEILRKYTNRTIVLWRNLVDTETLAAQHFSIATGAVIENKKFNMCYMSGSRAHEADFNEAFDAIEQIIGENPQVHFKVLGHAELAKKLLKNYPDQVTTQQYQGYFDYIKEFQGSDLNIIPLVQNKFNNCKSAIRFQEAAIMKVPTIVSAIGDFSHLVDHGVNGFLVQDNSNWYQALSELVKEKEALKKIGNNAYNFITSTMTTSHFELSLDPFHIKSVN